MAINQYTGPGGKTGDPYGESDQFSLASENTDGAALIYCQDNIASAPAGEYYMARMLFFETGEHRIEAYGCDGVEIRVDGVTVVLRPDASKTYESPATATFTISRRNAFRLDAIYRKAYPEDEEGNLVDGYDRSGWVAFVIYDPRGAATYHSNSEFWVWGRTPVPDGELSYGGGLDPNADDRLLLPTWLNQPDWADGILETLEWKTWLGVSESGAEQRASQRRSPRRMIQAQFTDWGPRQSAIHNALLAAGRHKQLVPLWMHRTRTTEDQPEQAVTIKADYRLREFKAGGLALIRDPENIFTYETVVIETLSDTEMSITIPLQREWPKGSIVEPLRVCRILDDPTLTQRSTTAVVGSVRFTQEEPEPQPKDVSAYPTHPVDGLPIIGLDNNWREDAAFGYQRKVFELDNQVGVPTFFDVSNQSKMSLNYRTWSRGRGGLDRLKSLLAYLAGRRQIVWLPTLAEEVNVIETIDVDVAEVVVQKAGLTLYGVSLQDTRRHIMFEMSDGSVIFNQLVSSRAREDAEVLVLADNFTAAYEPKDFAAIRFLSHARLAKDTIEIQHHTDSEGVQETALPFLQVSNLREA